MGDIKDRRSLLSSVRGIIYSVPLNIISPSRWNETGATGCTRRSVCPITGGGVVSRVIINVRINLPITGGVQGDGGWKT